MRAKDHYLYGAWAGMLNRVLKGKTGSKKCYAGIEVYQPWAERASRLPGGKWSFPPGLVKFAEWVDENLGPCNGKSLDRIDSTKGYMPGNLRWATLLEQNHNRNSGWQTKPRDDGKLRWAHKVGNRWLARFRFKKREYRVGYFDTMILAHQAAAAARKQLQEESCISYS
jgi:hypothetical protein